MITAIFQADKLSTGAGVTNASSKCSLMNCASMVLEAVGL